jgi:ribosomal protein L7Ae-like RNA K-turn-binding protein
MLDLLGLARRAGDLTLGFEQVDKALRSPRPPAVVIEAADAAQDGTRKLKAAALASGVYPFVIGCFSSAELGLALGLTNVVHASLKSGRFAEGLIFEAERLAGFRSLNSWVWAGYQGREKPADTGVGVERDE